MKSYKVYIDSPTWMCEGNLIESSRICRYMLQNGHEVIDNPSEADYIVINSCGFIKAREDDSVYLFKYYNSQKKEKALIIMFGCLIKINEDLINSLDVIPIDFGEGYKFDKIFYDKVKFADIAPYCDDFTRQKLFMEKRAFEESKVVSFIFTRFMLPFSKKVRLNFRRLIDRVTFKTKNLVEIGRGCVFNCSYCVIKKAKGNVSSRPIKDIISDIENLHDTKRNLFLVADDCGSYGLDIKTNLFELLYEIKKKFPDLSIELDAINPFWLEKYTNEYIKLFSDVNIKFAVIPVQSGSNKIIKDMNRKYDINNVIKIIKKIKKASPKTIVYTHFIIGYPRENIIDFIRTLFCVVHFDLPIILIYSGHKDNTSLSFPYSKSKFNALLKHTIIVFLLNFVIFHKLLSYPKY